jgi:hypothetical protein
MRVWVIGQFASRFLSALHGDDSSDDDFDDEVAKEREKLLDRIRYQAPFPFTRFPPRL